MSLPIIVINLLPSLSLSLVRGHKSRSDRIARFRSTRSVLTRLKLTRTSRNCVVLESILLVDWNLMLKNLPSVK